MLLNYNNIIITRINIIHILYKKWDDVHACNQLNYLFFFQFKKSKLQRFHVLAKTTASCHKQ